MRRLLPVLGAVLLLGACSTDPYQQQVGSGSGAPAALLDAYAIAHGMAVSYAASSNADPATVMQLIQLDARARSAVRSLQQEPGGYGRTAATAAAVAALTDFAARQGTGP